MTADGFDLAANALPHADARLPSDQFSGAIAVELQARQRRLEAVDTDRRLAIERAKHWLGQPARQEHQRPAYTDDRRRVADLP